MMDFKCKVVAYQENGDRTIIEDIIAAVETDFMKNRTRTRVKDGTRSGGIRISLDHHEYVSYRIRALRELVMRHEGEGLGGHIDAEFHRYLSMLYIDYGIEFEATTFSSDRWNNYYNLTPELFAELGGRMKDIAECLDQYEFKYFQRMFYENKRAVELRYGRVMERKAGIMKQAELALEYALKYVDASRSEKEIVKYINMTFSSRFGDSELVRAGMRRIQRKDKGQRQNYVIKRHFPEDLYCVIFGQPVKSEDLAKLTADQSQFIADVLTIVEDDCVDGDTTNYTSDIYGEVRISKNYVAEALGMRPDLLRQKLHRIKKKLV